ncbi:MAG: peptidylprolyl isomerase, partial [Planctomycetota bacterium]
TDAVIENKMAAFIKDIPPEQVVFARYQIGQRIVMEELLRQAVESSQLVVASKDLESCRGTFMKELEENSMTLDKLLEINRMSLKDFELQMVLKAYIDSKITPAMKDEVFATIKDQIKEGRVVSIIHKGGPAAKPEDKPGQRKALEDIRAKAVGGESFTELAIKYSDDPNVKDNKGKYPPLFRESPMYPEIIEAAFSLAKVGDISQVVETAQGCHLLKLESILLPNRGESHIERLLMQQCGNKLMQEFMRTLHDNSTVVVRKPPQPPQGMMGPGDMPPGEMPEDPR